MAFHFNMSIIKDHPVATAGVIIVGGLALYLLLSGGSNASGASSAPSASVDPSQVAANTNLQLAQMQNAAADANYQFQLTSQANKAASDLALATLNAQTSTTQQVNAIQGQEDIQSNNNSTQLAVTQATLNEEAHQAEVAAATQIATQQIASAGAVALAQTETAANIAIAQTNAQVQTNIAAYQSATAIATAQAQSNAVIAEANAFAGAQENSSNDNLIGSVFGGVLGAFF